MLFVTNWRHTTIVSLHLSLLKVFILDEENIICKKYCIYYVLLWVGTDELLNPVHRKMSGFFLVDQINVLPSVHESFFFLFFFPCCTSSNFAPSCQVQFLGRFSRILRRCDGFVTPAAHRSSSVMPLLETTSEKFELDVCRKYAHSRFSVGWIFVNKYTYIRILEQNIAFYSFLT